MIEDYATWVSSPPFGLKTRVETWREDIFGVSVNVRRTTSIHADNSHGKVQTRVASSRCSNPGTQPSPFIMSYEDYVSGEGRCRDCRIRGRWVHEVSVPRT